MSDWTKAKRDLENKMSSTDTNNAIHKVFGEISSRSAYSQILIGLASGWATGFTTMKIGKIAAFVVGGTIIFIEIAQHEGFIKIDWSKVTRKIDSITSNDRNWVDKAERYVDRKIDRAENTIKSKAKSARKWYSRLIGDDNGPKINDLHIFLAAFAGGITLGIASA